MSASATVPPPRGRRAIVALVALVLGSAALVFIGRAAVAHVARSALAERGLDCAPFSIDPAWNLSGVEVGATSCTAADARIRAVGLPYGASLELGRGLEPRAARVPEATAELGGELDLAGVGGSLLDGAVPEPMRAALSALAAAARRTDVPTLDVSVARVRRRDVTLLLHEISVSRDDGAVHIAMGDLTLPLHHGPLVHLEVRLESIVVRATPSDVSLDANIVLDARLAARELDRVVPIHVTGSGLDGDRPIYAMRLETSVDLAEVRARIAALAARRAERDATAGGREPLERIGEVADRLGALRARMEERAGATSVEGETSVPGPGGAAPAPSTAGDPAAPGAAAAGTGEATAGDPSSPAPGLAVDPGAPPP